MDMTTLLGLGVMLLGISVSILWGSFLELKMRVTTLEAELKRHQIGHVVEEEEEE